MYRQPLLVLLAMLTLVALPSATHADVATWHQGMTFASWWHDAYTKSSTITSLDQLANLKGNWVAIVPHWYMANRTSTTIYPETTAGTATDASVRYIIQQARNRGLKVLLKPHVDPRDGAWRGSISPSNVSAWFSSYRSFILHYAQIASETGVEMFSVGVEYKSMSGSANTAYWRSIVADVRQAYKGPLTYSANWGPKSWGEYYGVQWWDALDYIGIDAYFPITRANYPTVDQAKAGWYSYTDSYGSTNRWVDDMKALSAKFGKKVIFTEIGFNTVVNPGAEWGIQTGTDQTGAKNCTEATYQVFDKEPWMAGIFWWTWNVDPSRGGSSDRGMDINNKPMASTIASWYGRDAGTDTAAPSTPSGLAAQPLSGSSIGLGWSASTDNVGVAGYRVYRDGLDVSVVNGTTFTDAGLAPATSYSYQVCAFDSAGNRSALSAAVAGVTASAADLTRYDFENGTQGWVPAVGLTKIWNSTDIKYEGSRSLGLWADAISGSSNHGWVGAKPPSTLGVGATVTAQVYLDSSNTSVQGVAYVQDAYGGVVYGSPIALAPRTWTRLAVTVPANMATPLRGAGFRFTTNTGTYTGSIYVDDVRWDGISSPSPTGPALQYGFEGGTQGWLAAVGITKLWGSTDHRYEGSRSLGLWANAISWNSNHGWVGVNPPTTLGAGRTLTAQVYLSSSDTNVQGVAYVQGATGSVAYGPLTTLAPRTWTRVSITVPANMATPLRSTGFRFTSTGAYTGNIYVDDVRW